MSSHHIVRDAQEPALLILDPQYLYHEQLAPLLEWSPTILVSADALEEVLQLGLKVDAIICPPEKQREMEKIAGEQAPVKLLVARQSESILSTGLLYLKENGHQAVNVMFGEKAPEECLLKELARQEKIAQVVVLQALSRYALCRSGKFHKWFPAEESIRLVPAGEEPLGILISGFSNKVERISLKEPFHLKTAATGSCSMEADGPFWVVEQLG